MTTIAILLGSGNPNPDPNRSGPSVAIVVNDSVYIIDFGPGVVRRAIEAGLKSEQLNCAFLTHLHSDHCAGYPDLILTPAVTGRITALEVHGPRGLRSMTDHIMSAYEKDIEERLKGLEPAVPEAYAVNVHEIPEKTEGIIFQDNNVLVEAFPVNHGLLDAYGFKFLSHDKTIVVSGDTTPSEVLIEKAKNCDLLFHEVYSALALRTRPPEWRKYHSSVHTSSHELAELASHVKPKTLVLYHQLIWNRTEEDLLTEVMEGYNGHVVSGNDLDVF